jgi:hypothetical protein
MIADLVTRRRDFPQHISIGCPFRIDADDEPGNREFAFAKEVENARHDER